MTGQENALGPFTEAISNLNKELQQRLLLLPEEDKAAITEVRLYAGQPVALFKNRRVYFLAALGKLSQMAENCPKLPQHEVEENFRALCGYSVHSHQQEICQGFLSLPGGHRAGVCGTAIYLEGEHIGLRQITSINLRIAKRVPGCSNQLFEQVFQGKRATSLLLAGAPATGKTTMLRDLAQNLAGPKGGYCPIAIVDERGELSGREGFGTTAHILCGLPKAQGILQAVRTLAPQYILCDELGTTEEAQAMLSSLNAGVKIIATVHAGSKEELLRKEQVKLLLEAQGFETAAFLSSGEKPGQIQEIWGIRPYAENNRQPLHYSFRGSVGNIQGLGTEKECI